MVVHYNSLPIVVKFAHSLPTDGEKRSCTCQIRVGKEAGDLADTVLGTGTSVCNPKDNYCKSTGRKYALKRALKEASVKLQEIGQPVDSDLIAAFLQELHAVCKIDR